MRPLDPRLLRWARSTRWFLVVAIGLGIGQALVVIGQATLIATVVTGLFLEDATLESYVRQLLLLLGLALARGMLTGSVEWVAGVAGTSAKAELRAALVERLVALGPVGMARHEPANLAVLATRGIDALDAYFARYLPQLVLATVVPPIIGLTLLGLDLLAAVTVGLTLPLIPVFMILVGWYTQGRVERQWRTLGVLSRYFGDVVAGLPTLAIFGRSRTQGENLRRVTEDYRTATMGVLRISFLSSLVLELLSTLSVALVAVGIGVRLVDGDLDFRTGLLVLILAPEAYLPIRLVGVHYHAAAEGLGAAEAVLDVLAEPAPASGTAALRAGDIQVRALSAGFGATDVVCDLDATFRAGTVTAIVGPSGVGKTTLLNVLLGFLAPRAGEVLIDGVPLSAMDPARWRDHVAHVAQRPHLRSGSLRDALDPLHRHDAQHVRDALQVVGLDVDALPDGLGTHVGEAGTALSIGQRRRVALARALLLDAPVVILDEPTAALDDDGEQDVLAAIADLRRRGRTVVVVAHRPAIIAIADEVLDLRASEGTIAGVPA